MQTTVLGAALPRQNSAGQSLTSERPISEIECEMNQLEAALSAAAEMVDRVIYGIQPVLTPETVANGVSGNTQQPHAIQSPMADAIRSNRLRVEQLTERLRTVTGRLAI